jgi:hypothetical protein
VLAKGGQYGQHDGGSGAAGAGGAAASGVGDTKYSGGDGGGRADNGGGGGAGSAGTAADGNDGATASGDSGGAAGGAVAGGGAGGAGGDLDTNGFGGNAPGGGGGGAGRGSVTAKTGGSGAAGKVTLSYTGSNSTDSCSNSNVCTVTAGTMYKVGFNYKLVTGPGTMACRAYIGTARQGEATGLTETDYTSNRFYFTATDSDDLILQFDITGAASGTEFRVSAVFIKPVTSIVHTRNYDLPDECTGVYYATLDGDPIYYGEDPDGWFYDAEHNEFVFHENKDLSDGTDNLVVYYHTAQLPEYVVADILVSVGLYATQVAALAAMTYTETGTVIDRVWFTAGTSALAAIQQVCERVNYRFYFKYDGTPVFDAEPSIKAAGAEDATFEPFLIAGPRVYESTSELFNVISIAGDDIAQPLGPEQTKKNNYIGTATDSTSVTAYGDRTKSISNHLFQSDAVCSSMATTLLAAYKDPKRYLDFVAAINATPLELGDTLSVQLKISPDAGYGGLYDLFFYDDGTLYDTEGTTLTLRGKVRDIKLAKADATYRLELE